MTRDEIKAWAQALQPGDAVAIDDGNYGGTSFSIARVIRLTATQVITTARYTQGERRFRKEDARELGSSGTWSRAAKLEPVTDSVRDAIETAALKDWVRGLHQHHTVKLSLRVMRAMKAAHDAETAAEKAEAEKPATEGAHQ